MIKKQDSKAIQNLLDLDGDTLFIEESGNYWVKFEAKEVEVSEAKPHGIDYSLTLHSKSGDRLVGFDNAHAVARSDGPGGKPIAPNDHRHLREIVRPYKFTDAYALLKDFWKDVERVLGEEGVEL